MRVILFHFVNLRITAFYLVIVQIASIARDTIICPHIYTQVDSKYGETEVKIIGTRHGEKLYETLVTREEMARAIDLFQSLC